MSKHLSQKEIASPIPKTQKPKYFTTKRITYIATLSAITLILKILGNVAILTAAFKVSFTYLGWILSGIILGPIGGLIVGGLTDVIGTFALGYTINPIITLSASLFPFIVGIFYHYLRINNNYIKVIIGSLISTTICTVFLTSIGIYYISLNGASFSFWQFLILQRLPQIAVAVLNITLACLMIPFLKRLKILK